MTNSSRCGAGARSVFEPAPRRSVFRRRSSTCSGPRPPRGRRGGTSGVRCRAQAHRKLPGTPHPGHRLRPAKRKGNVTRTRTKGSARGRGNRTGNAKTDQSGNRIPTIGKEFNPAKARRIARIPRFSVATDRIVSFPYRTASVGAVARSRVACPESTVVAPTRPFGRTSIQQRCRCECQLDPAHRQPDALGKIEQSKPDGLDM